MTVKQTGFTKRKMSECEMSQKDAFLDGIFFGTIN